MTTPRPTYTEPRLEELPEDECQRLLSLATVGRIAFVHDGLPVVFPVNYRLLSNESGLWVLLRTRPGNVIDRAPDHVAFEIDGIDHVHQQGWSVLVNGVLLHLDRTQIEQFGQAGSRSDPAPWPRQERDSWLAIKPRTITGRRLRGAEPEWAFCDEAFL